MVSLRDELLALGDNTTIVEKQPAEGDHPLTQQLRDSGAIDALKRQTASSRDVAPLDAAAHSAVDNWDDEAGDWQKEVDYRQSMLDNPATSGLPPEILKSNLDYAKRKHAEAVGNRTRADALKAQNLSDFGMTFAQAFAPQPSEAYALKQYAESAGADRLVRGAGGLAEFLSLELQPPPGWKPQTWADTHSLSDFGRLLEQTAGSVTGTLAHFATIGAVTAGAGILPDMIAMGHGQMRQALEEKGVTDPQTLAKGSYVYGTLIGGLQAIVPWAAMKGLTPAAQKAFVGSIAEIATRAATHTLVMGGSQTIAMSLASVAETYGITDATGKPIDWNEVGTKILHEAPQNFLTGTLFGVAGEVGKATTGQYKLMRPEPKLPGARPSPTGGEGATPEAPAPTGQTTGQAGPTPTPQVPENAGEVTTQDLARELAILQTERSPEAEARKAEIEQQMAAPTETAAATPAEQPAKLTVPGVPNEDYLSKLASGEEPIPSTEELRGLRDKARGADEQYWQMLGAPPGTAARVRQLNRIADTAGGERADQAIAELNKLADQYAKEGAPEPGYMDEERLTHLASELDALDRRPDEDAATYLDGASRVLKRYLFDFINGDEMATVIWRKAFSEAQKAGVDTKELSDFAIGRVMGELSEGDRAFVGDMIREFTGRGPEEAAATAISAVRAALPSPEVESASALSKPAPKAFEDMTDGEIRLREMEALSSLAENPTQAQQYFQAAWGDVAQRFFQSLEYDLPSAGKRVPPEAKESLDRLTQSMDDVIQAIRGADKDAAVAAMHAARAHAEELLAKTDNAAVAKLFTQWVDQAWRKHVEPLLKLQKPKAAPAPAAPVSEAHRTKFRELLRGGSTRKQWGSLMGVDAKTLGALIADAEKQGLLRVDPRGVVRRTAKARTSEPAPTEPAATRDFVDHVKAVIAEVQPGEQMPIVDVYERMRAEGYDGTLDEFKAALAREARAGKIELARHDIAMPGDGGKAAIEEAVSKAIRTLNPSLGSNRIYIKDIIDATTGYSKEQIHSALLEMQKSGKIVLYQDDNPRTRTQDRINAGIRHPGFPESNLDTRTIVYVQPEFSGQTQGDFAARVQDIADALPHNSKAGASRDRVAIADVYDAYRQAYDDAGTPEAFKARLVEAFKRRELEAGRADLPERMDKDLRQRSIAVWGGDEVEFIQRSEGGVTQAEKLRQSRMQFGRDERHYVSRETARPERTPTFEEMRGILPKDEGGDADMGALTGLMRDRFGKSSWAELTADEKRAAFAEFSPRYALRTLLPGRISAEAVDELAARADDMNPNERQDALDWLEEQRQADIKTGEELARRCGQTAGGFSITKK